MDQELGNLLTKIRKNEIFAEYRLKLHQLLEENYKAGLCTFTTVADFPIINILLE